MHLESVLSALLCRKASNKEHPVPFQLLLRVFHPRLRSLPHPESLRYSRRIPCWKAQDKRILFSFYCFLSCSPFLPNNILSEQEGLYSSPALIRIAFSVPFGTSSVLCLPTENRWPVNGLYQILCRLPSRSTTQPMLRSCFSSSLYFMRPSVL